MDTSRLEALNDRLCEVGCALFGDIEGVYQAVVRVNGEHPMWRQALDSEWPGDADAGVISIRLVVEIFGFGVGRD